MCPLKPLPVDCGGWSVSPHWLALPAAELIQDRRPAAPVGVFASVGEEGRDLVPAPCGLAPLSLEGLGDRLARNRSRQR
jgi:hypothetical protein